MADAPTKSHRPAPGEPVIPIINWGGMRALYVKEVRRFFKVQLQTIWGPAVSALLLMIVFTVALGRGGREMMGVSFATFAVPGLMMMAMMQNAFANSSFSLMVGKMQGTIVDYLMPPLSAGELLAGLAGAAMTRGLLVGAAAWIAMCLWHGGPIIPQAPLAMIAFALLGTAMLSFIGVLTSLWAEKFDHNATITNFVIQPLSLLSGTFYSADTLHGAFRAISHANPFFYAISGFRYGFLGIADSDISTGLIVLLAVDLALGTACYLLLRAGWRIKS